MSSESDHSNEKAQGSYVQESSRLNKTEAGRGNLIVVSAPSGAGKSSLVTRVVDRLNGLRFSVSYTTRSARGAEKHGVDYYFISDDEFDEMQRRNEFLESAEVHGFKYATRRRLIEELLEQGLDVILDIDVQGAEQVRRLMPEAITIFILPPSMEVLESRLRLRNMNQPADLERRLRNAAVEVRKYAEFDYLIVNDDLERAASLLKSIITVERHRSKRQAKIAEAIIKTFEGESFHARNEERQ